MATTETERSGAILIVDDDPGMRGLLEVLLESAGFIPLCAPDGTTALSLLAERRDSIIGCLLDLNLDDCQGEDLYDQLVALHPGLAVFPMSGLCDDEIRERFGDRPICGVVPKPFQSRQLVDTLTRGLRERGR